jgi:hypothetical protein
MPWMPRWLISAAGPAPVIQGPQVNQLLVTTLSKLRDAFAAGSAELDAVPQNERDYTLMYPLNGVGSLLVPTEGRTLLDLVRPVSLESAIRQAPSCQAVDASAVTPGAAAMPTRCAEMLQTFPTPDIPDMETFRRRRDRAGSGAGEGRSVWCIGSRSGLAGRSPS